MIPMTRTTRAAGLLCSLALAAPAAAAAAQELTLRTADSLPSGHFISESLIVPFMKEVEAKSNGAVTFEYYPAQQLGKARDMLALTQTGVADIAYVGPSYVSDKMPLSSVSELPETFATSCEGTKAIWELAKEGGALDVAEYAPNGMRVLMLLMLPPYQIFSSRQLEGLSSLEGQKIRSSGSLKEIALSKMGAVPVQMAAPEAREALSRGTVDGIALPYSSILTYDMTPYIKSATDLKNLGSGLVTYMISLDKFRSLSPETQALLTEAGRDATFSGCEKSDAESDASRKKLEEAGVDFVTFPAEDMAKIKSILSTVGDDWAKRLGERGLPAGEILKSDRAALDH